MRVRLLAGLLLAVTMAAGALAQAPAKSVELGRVFPFLSGTWPCRPPSGTGSPSPTTCRATAGPPRA